MVLHTLCTYAEIQFSTNVNLNMTDICFKYCIDAHSGGVGDNKASCNDIIMRLIYHDN